MATMKRGGAALSAQDKLDIQDQLGITAVSDRLKNTRLAELLNWVKPVHMPVLDPNRYYGMGNIVSSLLTISHDTTTSDFSGSSIKLSASGVVNTATRIPIPAPAEVGVVNQKLRAGGAVHCRVKCSDWTKINRLYLGLTQDGGTTNYYLASVVNGGKSLHGNLDPAYSAVWNNVWRTIVVRSKDFIKVGSPAAWGASSRYFAFDGISVSIITTAAVDLWIDRIYSPDWPVGLVTPIVDGSYASAASALLGEYAARGWGAGCSANLVEAGGIYPTYALLKQLSAAGFDVFAHGHRLSGLNEPDTMVDATTLPTLAPILAAQRQALLSAGVGHNGMRWHQWLGNSGRGAFDVAGYLKKHGINASRGHTVDAEWGVNPSASTYISSAEPIDNGAWSAPRGRFNRSPTPAYTNISQGAEYDAAGTVSTSPTLKTAVDYAALTGQVVTSYDHQILDVPGVYDVSTSFHAARVAHMAELERQGKLLIVNPTTLEYLTYWRPGEYFMRWDGEWVYRHDPTKIAF